MNALRSVKNSLFAGVVALAQLASLALALTATLAFAQRADASRPELAAAYGKIPLSFEANVGQTNERVRFLARGRGYTLFLTPEEIVLSLSKRQAKNENGFVAPRSAVLRMKFAGANAAPAISGGALQPSQSNYFIGKDPAKWRTAVPHYGRVHYTAVYQGIDVVFYGKQRELEYDLVVAPGADPGQIELAFEGAQQLTVDPGGNLVISVAGGEVIHKKPVVYQEVDGKRNAIEASYLVKDNQRVGFQLAAFDASQPLVIDPVLEYSTYLGGGGGDTGDAIAVDGAGNAYVTGETESFNFPTTVGAFQTSFAGGPSDAFVAKLDRTGSALVYSTYLGGNGRDIGEDIAVDPAGNAYVIGITNSLNFPTANPLQPAYGGGFTDAFVAKLDRTGSALEYSTYLGGSGDEEGNGIDVRAGNAYVTGRTDSLNFPTTVGAFQTAFGGGASDAYVARLDRTGSALVYSTYLGGTGNDEGEDIAVDGRGDAYVTGPTDSLDFPTTAGAFQTIVGGTQDAYVTKLDRTGSALVYSTYLGGSGSDEGEGIALDARGNAYVTGTTDSVDFPTTVGAFQTSAGGMSDAFVAKLDRTGSALVYSTYLGGSDFEEGQDIGVDARGNAYVTGATGSSDFPTANPLQATFAGGGGDAYVAKLDRTGSALVYSTYLGGSGFDQGEGIAVRAGDAYVTGHTNSLDFPTANPLQPAYGGGFTDAFVAKITD
jgi:hypothetical protein